MANSVQIQTKRVANENVILDARIRIKIALSASNINELKNSTFVAVSIETGPTQASCSNSQIFSSEYGELK